MYLLCIINNKRGIFMTDAERKAKEKYYKKIKSINMQFKNDDKNYYYYDDNSCVKLSEYTGIVKIYAHRYIYIDGEAVSGWHKIDGDIYYAGRNKIIVKGTQKIHERKTLV